MVSRARQVKVVKCIYSAQWQRSSVPFTGSLDKAPTVCQAQGLTEAHRTRSCPSGSGWAGGKQQAVERAPSAVWCLHGVGHTDLPRGQLSQQPFQTEAQDGPLPTSAPVAPSHARWPSPSLPAAQTSTPQSLPCTVACRSALQGGFVGCLLPPSAQTAPCASGGGRVGTQPPSLGALVSSPVKGVHAL